MSHISGLKIIKIWEHSITRMNFERRKREMPESGLYLHVSSPHTDKYIHMSNTSQTFAASAFWTRPKTVGKLWLLGIL